MVRRYSNDVGVKGTWLIDWAKMVNKMVKMDPSKKSEFDKYLNEEDWLELKNLLIPSSLYDYGFFRRLGRAVFHVVAQGNLNATRAFGRLLIKNLVEVYKSILQKGDPIGSAKKLVQYHGICFVNVVSKIQVVNETEKSITLELTLTEEDKLKFPDGSEAYANQLAGSLEELVALAGAKNARLEIVRTPARNYLYKITWQ